MANKKRKEELAELKSPDQFVSFWSKVGEWGAKHQRSILTLVVTVVAATAALQAGKAYFGKRDAGTSRAFARIERVANAPLLPAEGDAPKFDDGLPHFKTSEERTQAALKEADAFLAQHGRGKLAAMAELLKANYLRDLQKFEEALPLFQKLTTSDDLPAELQLLAWDGLALTQESLGKLDDAIATLDKLAAAAKTHGGFFGDRAAYNKARLLESQGKADAARTIYRAISTDYPETPLREDVNRRLALLDEAAGDGVESATP